MNPTNSKLLLVLQEFCLRYSHWRLGQVVANVAGWQDRDPADISDEELQNIAQEHLTRRFGPVSQETVSATRFELFEVLKEAAADLPSSSLGQRLIQAANTLGSTIYDLEDDLLLGVLKKQLHKELVA